MTNSAKILLGVLVVLLVGAGAVSAFGIVEIPGSPVQGLLAGDEADDGTGTVDDGTGVVGVICPPGQVDARLLGDSAASGVDPATGLPLEGDSAGDAGAVDPATGLPLDDATGAEAEQGAIDPTTGLPADGSAGVSYETASGAPRMIRASAVIKAGAADGSVDPATGLPIEGGSGAPADDLEPVDPATGLPFEDPAAGADAAIVDPNCVDDPNATGDSGTGGGNGIGGNGQNGNGKNQPQTPSNQVSDGTDSGNSPEALRIASSIAEVLIKANIQVKVDAKLLPVAGALGKGVNVKNYRNSVTAAIVTIQLTDPQGAADFKQAPKGTKSKLLNGFISRLRANYPKASTSVVLIDASNTPLASSDAGVSGSPTFKLYG